jgi:hypothetical protein
MIRSIFNALLTLLGYYYFLVFINWINQFNP